MPFMAIDRNLDSNTPRSGPCCLFDDHKQNDLDPEGWWQSKDLLQLRKEFLRGERPKGCFKCWNDEDNAKKSLRQSINESRFQKDLLYNPKIQQIKFSTGSNCNLACRMCLPQLSTGVHKIWNSLGKNGSTPYQYDIASEHMIKKYTKDLKYIDVIGGEPFYHKKFLNLLEWLVDNKHAENITMFITSNMTIIHPKIIDHLQKFKKVVISASLDGVSKVYEYIRPGSNFETVVKNMETCREHFDVIVASTINVLNILRLPDLDRWCTEHGFHQAQKGLVYNPIEMNPKQLPTSLRSSVTEKYKVFLQTKTYPCIPFIKALDDEWGTDICEVMPEWSEALQDDNDFIEKDYEIHRKTLDYIKKI